ncbi:hypothetical protein [Streptomyces vinaceus]|uniref:hypothetical protein n=1 Tax=Streptomyces vinaceus TaxID=1960 RepID=UPI0035DB2268
MDLFTGFVVVLSLATGWLVYRLTVPSPRATTPSKGERISYAVVAAASVVAIGAYAGSGIKGVERAPDVKTERVVESAMGSSSPR